MGFIFKFRHDVIIKVKFYFANLSLKNSLYMNLASSMILEQLCSSCSLTTSQKCFQYQISWSPYTGLYSNISGGNPLLCPASAKKLNCSISQFLLIINNKPCQLLLLGNG
jgi:hypothetical protein